MAEHRYRIGQRVGLAARMSRSAPTGSYVVTKRLPERDGEVEYRIKHMSEAHERVARESELIGE
jgi:hypothetical protein